MTTPQSREIETFRQSVSDRLTNDQNLDLAVYLRQDEWQSAVDLIGRWFEDADLRLSDGEWAKFVDLATSYDLDPNSFDIAPH